MSVSFRKRIEGLIGRSRLPDRRSEDSIKRALKAPGAHEYQIAKALGPEALKFSGNTPEFDFPLILIGFTNRSGSTLLGEYLLQSRMLRGLGEFCNHDFVLRQMQARKLKRYPELIRALAANRQPGQLFGMKTSWDQIAMLARWNIPAMFSGVRIIHVARRDALAQAISHSIATQTNQWSSQQESNHKQPVFDAGELDRIMQTQRLEDALILHISRAMDFAYQGVFYEALVTDPTRTLRNCLAFCGVARPEWHPAPPVLKKQSGPVNEEFRRRYLQMLRQEMLGPRP